MYDENFSRESQSRMVFEPPHVRSLAFLDGRGFEKILDERRKESLDVGCVAVAAGKLHNRKGSAHDSSKPVAGIGGILKGCRSDWLRRYIDTTSASPVWRCKSLDCLILKRFALCPS